MFGCVYVCACFCVLFKFDCQCCPDRKKQLKYWKIFHSKRIDLFLCDYFFLQNLSFILIIDDLFYSDIFVCNLFMCCWLVKLYYVLRNYIYVKGQQYRYGFPCSLKRDELVRDTEKHLTSPRVRNLHFTRYRYGTGTFLKLQALLSADD